MTAQTSHKWGTIFINGDYEEFSNDLRGGKQTDSFYDTFPDIETDAKIFVVEACSRKSAEFKASDLAQFIDTKYYPKVVVVWIFEDGEPNSKPIHNVPILKDTKEMM